MATHVALLRGINIGARNRVAMPALREVVRSFGHRDVETYIQSGNVLFTPPGRRSDATLAAELEHAIEEQLGVAARVAVRTREQLAAVVSENPYSGERNPKAVHAVFLTDRPGRDLIEAVEAEQRKAREKGTRDQARVVGQTLFVHTPEGYGRSELATALMRRTSQTSGTTGTARNWATVTKLLELLEAQAPPDQ